MFFIDWLITVTWQSLPSWGTSIFEDEDVFMSDTLLWSKMLCTHLRVGWRP